VQRAGAELMEHHPALADRLVARWIGAAARYADA
jgi:ATP-dependent DNA helicase RecG